MSFGDHFSLEAKQATPPAKMLRPGMYRHYKGGEYELMTLGRMEADSSPVAIYLPANLTDLPWVRPEAEFREKFTRIADPRRPWPHEGQKFEVFVAVYPDEESGTVAQVLNAPQELAEVMSDDCGDHMEECLFHENDIPRAIGLHRVTLAYWFQEGFSEGYADPSSSTWGFNVLTCEKVAA